MTPPPTPTSQERKSRSSMPTPAPRRCSARAPRSASLRTTTGTPRLEPLPRRVEPAARSTSPGWARSGRSRPRCARHPDGRHADPDQPVAQAWSGRAGAGPGHACPRASPRGSGRRGAVARARARGRGRPGRRWRHRASARRCRWPARRRRRWSACTVGDGRPGMPRRSPGSSWTRPSSESSATMRRHGAAVETRERHELGTRARTRDVDLAQHGAEVVTPDRL